MIGRRRFRTLLASLAGLLLAASVLRVHAATPLVSEVDSIGITVDDMERSVDFYSRVLSFKRESDTEVSGDAYEHVYGLFGLRLRLVRMRLGDEAIDLMQFLAPGGRPAPVDSRSNDRWFQHVAIIVSDMSRAYALLRGHNVEHASSGPQRLPDWNPNAGGIEAFYFRDPDGNPLEILHFPAGKGAAKWHAGGDRLFLGIDHTAIVVADTEASMAFYRDTLGLSIAGTSENYGTEQEHLNNVFGARLRITALRAAAGPGVELLEYLAPRTGRPMPADSQPNDAWHAQINMLVRDVRAAEQGAREGHYAQVSSGVIELAPGSETFLLRDPDGHASLLRQK
ncbi:MAG TPA: VOC family protein [Steroidobacteraceae bacterium]|nr:VOC family protein [Steroidobacteraceae bacterium]